MFGAAFYKSTRPGIAGLYNIAVRAVTKGEYSHCELIFSDPETDEGGLSASASFLDGGVRFKRIEFNPDHWDFIELPAHLEPHARAWFEAHEGQGYDILGNIRFLFFPVPEQRNKFMCSEAIGSALTVIEAWRFEPNALSSALKLLEAIRGR